MLRRSAALKIVAGVIVLGTSAFGWVRTSAIALLDVVLNTDHKAGSIRTKRRYVIGVRPFLASGTGRETIVTYNGLCMLTTASNRIE